jgi:hypothetical protein
MKITNSTIGIIPMRHFTIAIQALIWHSQQR